MIAEPIFPLPILAPISEMGRCAGKDERVIMAADRALLVRRWDIESTPRPAGGGFAPRSVLPIPLPHGIMSLVSVYCVNTKDRVFSITYDDGPHPENTPRVLDVLARFGVKATFFVLAREAEKYPALVQRAVAEGHEIGLHGYDHRSLLTMSTRAAMAEIRRARKIVEDIAGTPVRLYRPPYGEHTLFQGMAIRMMGLENVTWSGGTTDWLHDDEDVLADRAIATVFTGGILLLHDARGDPETMAPGEVFPTFDRGRVSELVLETLIADGYRTLTVSKLLAGFQNVRSVSRDRMTRR